MPSFNDIVDIYRRGNRLANFVGVVAGGSK
jgi:hypothetical protein